MAPGAAASGVVVSRRRSASTPSSALDSTATGAAPSPAPELQTGPSPGLSDIDDADAVNGERDRYRNALEENGKIQYGTGDSESQELIFSCGNEGEVDWFGHIAAREIWVVRCEGAVESWVVLKKIDFSENVDGM